MALIPPFFIDSVVAIGVDDPEGRRKWIASGFIYGRRIADKEDGQPQYRVYLVSNRHVFEGLRKVYLRVNPQADEPAREYDVDLVNETGAPIWIANPNTEMDVAVIPINIQILMEQGM